MAPDAHWKIQELMLQAVADALGPALHEEVQQSPDALRQYIAEELNILLNHRDFEYAVQSTARNNRDRESLIFARGEVLANLR